MGDEKKSADDVVVSLRRGLELLRVFRPNEGPLSQAEIARRTGLAKGTVARLLHTLVGTGHLSRLKDLSRYQPAPAVFAMGQALLGGLSLRQTVRPVMQDLADKTNASVAVGTGERLDVVYLDHCVGKGAADLRLGTGSLVPMGLTAAGRAYLWGLPGAQREPLLAALAREAGPGAADLADAIRRSFEMIRDRGFCASPGSWRREVFALAAPLIFHETGTVLVLNCAVPWLGADESAVAEVYGGPLLKALQDVRNVLGREGLEGLGFGDAWATEYRELARG